MPATVKIKKRKRAKPAPARERVAFAPLWDSPDEEIKAHLEGRRITFVWRSDLTDIIMEETYEVHRVHSFNTDTMVLTFWAADGRQGGARHAFRVTDVADIR